jgi:exodeoxyribonuclease VII large subunit
MSSTLTVTQLTQAIKQQLESRFTELKVSGEITNLKEQSSGHIYFSLKDQEAQIAAAFFRGNAKNLRQPLKNGDHVVVKGQLNVYAPRGNYQIIVREIEFAGVGELLLHLHEMKKKLEERGWLSPDKKKALPKYPKTIGVITSPTGAVIQDIIHVLSRRFAGFHLVLYPVKVQGEGAAQEIATAIQECNRHHLADVLIVGRGGGSLEDLWAFNEEPVINAVYHSEIPIVTAIGHETDTCLSDLVADKRAPTPSAAAEIVLQEKAIQTQFLADSQKTMLTFLRHLLAQHRSQIRGIARQPIFTTPYTLLGTFLQSVDEMRTSMSLSITHQLREKRHALEAARRATFTLQPLNQIHALSQRLKLLEKTLNTGFPIALKRAKEQFNQLVEHLKAIDPKNLLTKGYSILFRENGHSVIVSRKDVVPGERIQALFHDGKINLQVDMEH